MDQSYSRVDSLLFLNQFWLWYLAVPMAYFSAWLLKRASNAKSSLDNAIVFYILAMMASMLVGAIWYFLEPTTTGVIEGLGLNMFVMSVGVIAVLRYWAGEGEGEDSEITTDPNELELERAIKISSGYVVYILVMMASMTATETFYIINTALTGLEEGLIAGTVIMTAGVVGILWYSSRHSKIKIPVDGNNATTKLVRSSLISLVLLNEFLMGWLFTVVTGTPKITGGSLAQIAGSTVTSVAGSDWFLFTMALEITLSMYMLRSAFSKKFVGLACMQSLALLFVPTAINMPVWVDLCAAVDATILLGFLILGYRYWFKHSTNDDLARRYFLALLTFYVAAMAGFIVWVVQGSALLLLISMAGGMVLYFKTIIERTTMKASRSMTQRLTESSTIADRTD
jgi:hypothetical protein